MTTLNIDGLPVNVNDAAEHSLPAFLDVPETAAHLGVHTALIYKEIRAGRLKAVKIGARVIRISREALAAYTAMQATGAN